MIEESFDSEHMDRWWSVTQGSPGDCEWGFYSYGDASPAIGGGVGSFVWFPDRGSMLDFIIKTLPYEPPGPQGSNLEEISDRTSKVVEKLRIRSVSDSAGVAELNLVLRGFSQIEWLGTVSDLLSGDHPYAAKVREAFREIEDEDIDDSSPIGDEEKNDFYEFLESWGV